VIDRQIGQQILRRLDAILGLMVHVVITDKTQAEKIRVLSSASFQPREIAQMIGTTANTVRVALSVARKGKRNAIGSSRRRYQDEKE